MAQKFPENLPPKGRGRVDDKHQIALLTDFEIAALNTLKNRDKERGFPSGSGPEIRALAAQNSRPFEFVNYRGERIPSLNDLVKEDMVEVVIQEVVQGNPKQDNKPNLVVIMVVVMIGQPNRDKRQSRKQEKRERGSGLENKKKKLRKNKQT